MLRAIALAAVALQCGCLLDIDLTRLDGATTSGDGGPLAGCPSGTVTGPSGCVDATVVTRARYAQFLASRAGDTSGQPDACRTNSTHVPEGDWPPSAATEALPVVHVDWCDAAAFCRWRSARLCGRNGGGPDEVATVADPASGEWAAACTRGLLDLGGNVAEWQDACDEGPGASGGNDPCVALGGDAMCANAMTSRRSSAAVNLGFRCCDSP